MAVLTTALGGGAQRAFSGLLLLFMVALGSRFYGDRAAGVIGISTTMTLVLIAVADFGTTPISLRRFSELPPTRGEFYSLFRLKVMLGLISSAVVGAACLAVFPSDLALATLVALAAVPLTSGVTTAMSLFTAHGRGAPLTLGAVIGWLTGVGVSVALVAIHAPLWLVVVAFPAARITELLVLLKAASFAQRDTSSPFRPSDVIRSWPMGAQTILQMLYQRSTVLGAGWILGTVAAGRVTQGISVYAALALVPSVLATAGFPGIVAARRESRAKTLRVSVSLALLQLAIAAPLAALLLFFADPLATVLFGAESVDTSLVGFLRWCGIALLLAGPNSLVGFVYLAFGRERQLAGLSALICPLSAALVVVGAKIDGVAGVGWSVAASEVVSSVCFGIAWVVAERGTKKVPDSLHESQPRI